MHGRANIDFVDGVILDDRGAEAAQEVQGAVAEEDAIDDAVHFFHHLLDPGRRPHGVREVHLVGVDPLVGVVDRHSALTLHLSWQGVVLLAEEGQLDLSWQEIVDELVHQSRSNGTSGARDNDIHSHIVLCKFKVVGVGNRRQKARLRPQVLDPRIVHLPRENAAQRPLYVLYSSENAIEYRLLLRSTRSLIRRWLHFVVVTVSNMDL